MRDYAIVSPKFWTGETGKYIRKLCLETPEGHLHRSIATYLVTAPTSNMIGLYYLPLPTLCHETGSPFEGALKALRSLSEGGFAHYDEETETVWMPEMPKWQLNLDDDEGLKEGDNRIKGINHLYQELPKCPFLEAFFDKWGDRLRLEKRRANSGEIKPLQSPFRAPSKPLRSQDQDLDQDLDQDRDQDHDLEQDNGTTSLSPDPLSPCPHQKLIDLYHTDLPELPRVHEWPETYQKHFRARWSSDPPNRASLDWWHGFYLLVGESSFLMGNNDRGFRATLGWLVLPTNFAKVLNGQYHNNLPREKLEKKYGKKGAAAIMSAAAWLEKKKEEETQEEDFP